MMRITAIMVTIAMLMAMTRGEMDREIDFDFSDDDDHSRDMIPAGPAPESSEDGQDDEISIEAKDTEGNTTKSCLEIEITNFPRSQGWFAGDKV